MNLQIWKLERKFLFQIFYVSIILTIINFLSLWTIILVILRILIGVAFITLLERKILRYSQYRKGPNKVGLLGTLQPIADAVKLFTAEICYFSGGNNFFFYGTPIFRLSMPLLMWIAYPWSQNFFCNNFSIFFVLVIMSLRLFPLLIRGLSASNCYTTLGAYRGVAQIISYEIVIILILIIFFFFTKKISIIKLLEFNNYFIVIWLFPRILIIWLLSALAESNRTPFDFSEGESELVSGFNTEYGGWWFAYIFIGEYARIIFLALIRSVFINSINRVKLFITIILFIFFWFCCRSAYPRHRFDKLINLCYKSLIPFLIILIIILILINIF